MEVANKKLLDKMFLQEQKSVRASWHTGEGVSFAEGVRLHQAVEREQVDQTVLVA